jgi:ribosomal protein S18 acetylase RimI-like enzyme
MNELRVRPATVDDASAIAMLHVRSWREAYRDLAPDEAYSALDEPLRLARWRELLTAPQDGRLILLAERAGRAVGVGVAGPPSSAALGSNGEISSLYVDPASKRTGIGLRLMGELARQIAAWGYAGVALGVVEGNAAAIAFYESLGCRTVGRYVDPGPLWRSINLVLAWDDASALASRCIGRGS